MNKFKNIIKRITKDSINNLNKLFKATLNISIMFILFIKRSVARTPVTLVMG